MTSPAHFRFLYPEWYEITPASWLDRWSKRYGDGDNAVYFELINRTNEFSSEEYEMVGRWKESCLKKDHGSWKTGTPKAYDVWMKAKEYKPTCPDTGSVARFLEDWSERRFNAGSRGGQALSYRFGLSRATTLLHFVSGAKYPILDSRVLEALRRLGAPIGESVEDYLFELCPTFAELARTCGVSGVAGLRKLDNALFCYGAEGSFDDNRFTGTHSN